MAGALGSAMGTILGSNAPHRVAFALALNGVLIVVFIILPSFFPGLRKYLWQPPTIRKRPLSEERVLDGAELVRVLNTRPRSILSRILSKIRH
jgi:hypothetical protein